MWSLGVLALMASMPIVIFVARRRLRERTACTIAAVTYALATAYSVWVTEWFDVYRLGMPPLAYFLKTVVLYAVSFGIAGWFVALGIMRLPRLRTPLPHSNLTHYRH
jgi:hypothetical protein